MGTIGAYEAKTHLPRLLEEVSEGASYIITKHGRPVARLSAVRSREGTFADVAATLLEARQGITLGEATVRDLVEKGRP